MSQPVHIAFLGCGFITAVHSRHLRKLDGDVVLAYASRDRQKAEEYCRKFGGAQAYGDYRAAIDDPGIDAVVVAVPTAFHLDLTLGGLERGKHVLVEKPAFPRSGDYRTAIDARDRAKRVVIVGENDHYKPLAIHLRKLLARGAIGDMLLAHFVTIARRLKTSEDWRNDETMAGGDAFFEEGIHWLHLANSLGPRITRITGFRPPAAGEGDGRLKTEGAGQRLKTEGADRRLKTMMVAFQYDNGAAGSLYYSREIPSLLRGLRFSKIFGRTGIITFESNGLVVAVRGMGFPQVAHPGLRDIRGYRAMYRDFLHAIRGGGAPEMSLERALEDQHLMDEIYRTVDGQAKGPGPGC
jgi:predicted dehydrogenase